MKQKTRVVLQPKYMAKFKCIGPACEDTCCAGWSVNIDKETYLKYRRSQNEEYKFTFDKSLNRKHNQKSDETYARIKMDENGRCPFLDEQCLCKIHRDLGENYLSNTCALYPRHLRLIDGKFERTASVSCPEIARLALLNPEGIGFEQLEEDVNIRHRILSKFDTEGHLYINKAERYFWDIRIFSLALLQNRNYNLSERLIMLGITYSKIQELQKNKQASDISDMLKSMNNIIEEGSLKEELEKVPNSMQIQMRLTKEMIDIKVAQGISSQVYFDCIEETLRGIECIDKVDYEVMLKKYEENTKEFLVPYLKDKEYILENYLVNEYFKEQMPFGAFKSIWDSYVFLCVLYSILKLHMIGMAGYHKGLNDDLTIKLIYSFSRMIIHNNKYIQGIIKLIKENQYDSLAYMAILVKN